MKIILKNKEYNLTIPKNHKLPILTTIGLITFGIISLIWPIIFIVGTGLIGSTLLYSFIYDFFNN